MVLGRGFGGVVCLEVGSEYCSVVIVVLVSIAQQSTVLEICYQDLRNSVMLTPRCRDMAMPCPYRNGVFSQKMRKSWLSNAQEVSRPDKRLHPTDGRAIMSDPLTLYIVLLYKDKTVCTPMQAVLRFPYKTRCHNATN